MDAFETALRTILRVEGGYTNDPRDRGGPTLWGVTQATYDRWRGMQGLPPAPVAQMREEEMREIYRRLYWDPIAKWWAEKQDRPGVALYLFDAAINHGLEHARRFEARHSDALRLHPLDGLAALHADRVEFYTHLKTWPVHGKGWMRRVSRVYLRAVDLEHPQGLIRVKRLFLDGDEHPVEVARQVGDKLYVRRWSPSRKERA